MRRVWWEVDTAKIRCTKSRGGAGTSSDATKDTPKDYCKLGLRIMHWSTIGSMYCYRMPSQM